MTEKTEKIFNNIVGIQRLQRNDGKPSAILAIRGLRANADPTARPTKNGNVAINFPANISADDYKKKALRYAMNGMSFPEYNGRINVNVSLFVNADSKYYDWIMSRLQKGSLIPMLLGTLESNTYSKDGESRTTLNLTIDPSNLSTIKLPDLNDEDVEAIRQHVVLDSVVKNGEIVEQGDKKFIRMASSFVNIDDIHIDLIDQINPFQKAFEILSKSITSRTLKLIDEHIQASKVEMTEEEALLLWSKIVEYRERTGELPNLQSHDPKEKRMAEAIIFLREQKRKRQMGEI